MKRIWVSESKEETWSLEAGRMVQFELCCVLKNMCWGKKGWAVAMATVAWAWGPWVCSEHCEVCTR